MSRTRLLTATVAVGLFAAGAAFAQTPPAPLVPSQQEAPQPGSVIDVLRADGQFTTLLRALDVAQLTEILDRQAAVTLFAPTDAAFAALAEAERDRLLDPANAEALRQVLLYHVVVADMDARRTEGSRGGVQTAAGIEVQVDGAGDALKIDNATVTTADIEAGNGAVFVIDRVLNPATSQVASGDAEAADDSVAPLPEDIQVEVPAGRAQGAHSAADEAAVPPSPIIVTVDPAPAAAPTAPVATPAVSDPADEAAPQA